MDKYIRVKNCNCISDATIEIVEKSLNIKYGSNGTGKSTISEAIYAQANNETDRLKDFKPYGSNDNSQPTVDNPYFHVVKVFNEDYVNSYLFQGDEFLDDSFQVFLKSDKCDSLAAQIERIQYSHKPYTPDFVIYQNGKIAYIEHFGITENGKNDRYSQDELEQYKKAINDKIKLHKQHDTTLIYTFYKVLKGRSSNDWLEFSVEKQW